jgi:gas vesicle protein
MREYEDRFETIEKNLEAQVNRLRADYDSRMDKFEEYVKDELKKLGEKITQEKKERVEEEKAIGNDMSALEDRLTSSIGDVDAQIAHDTQEIRESLRDQVKELMNSIRQLQDDLSKDMDAQSGALKDAKVDREALADMLTEMSMRLKGELQLPE